MKTLRWSLFPPQHQTVDKGHGRLEIRQIWTSTELNSYIDFPYVGQVFCIRRLVTYLKTNKETEEIVYGITSLTRDEATAERLLKLNRGHWSIENSLYHVRDVTFDEDRSQIRTRTAPRVMATLRNFVISILRYFGKNNIAQTLRTFAHKPHLAMAILRI